MSEFKFINKDGSLNKDAIQKELYISNEEKSSIYDKGIWATIISIIQTALLIAIITYINEFLQFEFKNVSLCILWILILLSTIFLSLYLHAHKLEEKTTDKLTELEKCVNDEYNHWYNIKKLKDIDRINTECLTCLQIKKGDNLNAYNLFTYEQILQIEEKVGNCEGDRSVFSYSTYRDDGDNIGIPEAEEIIKTNKSKGVKYYEVFYKDLYNKHSAANDDTNELLINLSSSEFLGANGIEKCLDYKFYKDSRFDIMIYQYGDNVEGYFCLNFPLIRECSHYNDCPIKCDLKNRTAKVFYKKMVNSITLSLHKRLSMLVKNKEDKQFVE